MNRPVSFLLILMAVLFGAVGIMDSEFLLLHVYEAGIYIVIAVMVAFGHEELAYPLAFLTPLIWIVLNFLTGLLGAGARQVGMLISRGAVSNVVSLMAIVISVSGIVLAATSLYYYRKEIHGSPTQGPKNFGLAALISVAFYSVLVLWFAATV